MPRCQGRTNPSESRAVAGRARDHGRALDGTPWSPPRWRYGRRSDRIGWLVRPEHDGDIAIQLQFKRPIPPDQTGPQPTARSAQPESPAGDGILWRQLLRRRRSLEPDSAEQLAHERQDRDSGDDGTGLV